MNLFMIIAIGYNSCEIFKCCLVDNGGSVVKNVKGAQFIFSMDFNAEDTVKSVNKCSLYQRFNVVL